MYRQDEIVTPMSTVCLIIQVSKYWHCMQCKNVIVDNCFHWSFLFQGIAATSLFIASHLWINNCVSYDHHAQYKTSYIGIKLYNYNWIRRCKGLHNITWKIHCTSERDMKATVKSIIIVI